MRLLILLMAVVVGPALSKRRSGGGNGSCPRVDNINRSLRDVYCDQPIFVNFLPKTEENQLLDNICYTFFPLPDDPNTFQVYMSKVYCDASNEVISYIATDFGPGVHRFANPFLTGNFDYFGYAGCETYIASICAKYGRLTGGNTSEVNGLSSSCSAIGLSCLRKVEEVIRENGLPDMDFYALPMRLPNRCVTQQQCIASTGNQFYKALGLAGPLQVY